MSSMHSGGPSAFEQIAWFLFRVIGTTAAAVICFDPIGGIPNAYDPNMVSVLALAAALTFLALDNSEAHSARLSQKTNIPYGVSRKNFFARPGDPIH